jgi:DNA-binding phage protein
MTRKYPNFTSLLDDYLQDPPFAADFLLETLAEDDFDVFLLALKDVQRVHVNLSSTDKLPIDE